MDWKIGLTKNREHYVISCNGIEREFSGNGDDLKSVNHDGPEIVNAIQTPPSMVVGMYFVHIDNSADDGGAFAMEVGLMSGEDLEKVRMVCDAMEAAYEDGLESDIHTWQAAADFLYIVAQKYVQDESVLDEAKESFFDAFEAWERKVLETSGWA